MGGREASCKLPRKVRASRWPQQVGHPPAKPESPAAVAAGWPRAHKLTWQRVYEPREGVERLAGHARHGIHADVQAGILHKSTQRRGATLTERYGQGMGAGMKQQQCVHGRRQIVPNQLCATGSPCAVWDGKRMEACCCQLFGKGRCFQARATRTSTRLPRQRPVPCRALPHTAKRTCMALNSSAARSHWLPFSQALSSEVRM